MDQQILFGKTLREILTQYLPGAIVLLATIFVVIKYVNPAPPRKIVMATGDGEGDYQTFAKRYKSFLKSEGIELELKATKGSMDNVRLLNDEKSDVTVAFVQDGLVTQDQGPDLMSLGSLYYEPLWIFYRNKLELPHHVDLTKLSQLVGRRIGIGEDGSGTSVLAKRLLEASGVTSTNSTFVFDDWDGAEDELRSGDLDVAFLVAPPDDPLIEKLMQDPDILPLSLDQAEAVTKQLPFLHHLTLPHGAISLAKNLPAKDIDVIAPTATLLAKDDMHPALVYMLLKAANQVHSDPGIFEKKNEFPAEKDYEIAISTDAKEYYVHGIPFWQRYLPFWLATLLERFIFIALPFIAVVLPILKSIPRFLAWRARTKILARYAELRFLENKIRREKTHEHYPEHLKELAKIEEKVNNLHLSNDYTEDIFGLRSNIHFVRENLRQDLNLPS